MIATACPHCGKSINADTANCPHCACSLAVTLAPSSSNPMVGTHVDPPTDMATLAFPARATPARFQFLSPPHGDGELGRVGNYRVLRLLGEGGMGMVFEAEDPELHRKVALKVIRPEMAGSPEFRGRFMREARATAAVKSDHIVNIHQVGQHNEVPFLAMEFLHGKSLDAWMREHERPALDEVFRIGAQIADGLADAHEKGLIHRDIKPANIWIEAPSGRVRILDFGLARIGADDARLTSAGSIMGTPAYMAPEQADGQNVDARVDLFSLGCILYELTTGKRAFDGASALAVLKAVALKTPEPVAALNPTAPPALAAIIERLLAKDPNQRPGTAREVAQQLRQPSTHATPTAIATTPPATPQRQPRRWLLISAGSAIVACLMGMLVLPKSSALPSRSPRPVVQGVTENEIVIGMTGPFSGSAREFGREMELGINTLFRSVNDQGGVAGRNLRLVVLDDGYEPDRALNNVIDLDEKHKVFAYLGNVGSATTAKALPYALDKKRIWFGGLTGSLLLRNDPPDRFVFNYRPSFCDETGAAVRYLVETRKLKPEQIAVFAQQDSYGDAGFQGVTKAMHKYGRDPEQIVRVGYPRNSSDVAAAAQEILKQPDIRAVVMVATYRPAARFIQMVRDVRKDTIFTNVSFVETDALVEELKELGPNYTDGVIVTQVVPDPAAQASAVLRYRELLSRYYPNEHPTFISLEAYLSAAILVEGLRRAGDDLNTDTLVAALETIRDLDLGLGAPISFMPSDHQASHKVWGTVLDRAGKVVRLDLGD